MNIFRSALSLVLYKKGKVAQADIDQLLKRYRDSDRIELDAQAYRRAVDAATEHYWRKERCFFICTGRPCDEKSTLDTSDLFLTYLANKLQCPIELTGCHWRCEVAPVATLKLGEMSHSFSIMNESSWIPTVEKVRELIDSRTSEGEERYSLKD